MANLIITHVRTLFLSSDISAYLSQYLFIAGRIGVILEEIICMQTAHM